MGANTNHYKPLWLLGSLGVGFRVSEIGKVDRIGLINFSLGSVADKHWLSSPLDNNILAFGDVAKTNFNLCHGQHISRGRHGGQKVLNGGSSSGSGNKTQRSHHKVGKDSVRVLVTILLQVWAEIWNLV